MGLTFEECSFKGCTFRENVFQAVKFRRCVFDDCDFSLAQFPETIFQALRFENCRLVGVNWAAAHYSKMTLHKPFDFLNCILNYGVFIGLNLKGVGFEKCIAHEVDFSEGDLRLAVFHGTDLMGSRFNQSDLREADFSRAFNYTIDAGVNKIKQAKFSLPEAMALLSGLGIELVDS
ncbi:MAG TPA: pentapeptide repeat-containing protein [Anaerolineales bacterium]|nr:pentapeptide repeat-containing protein [Anaerolineales bacterium]